ncbi:INDETERMINATE(ID)-DOMAIN 15, SHOOT GRAVITROPISM 5, ARABIDOPSIS THALIANA INDETERMINATE(ID)-DOMAIN 15 [Hibiscus trionum]|uniref:INDETERMINATE(ID)-DOMAIN 15, SHOOT GRAVITROPISM 5, ARABIDOPSIS THALIANA INDETERMINATE(ID)-DOMAIN 15 n=1 Tax=Hibiscus trionum TaxID=183268 RepID=A0A9W7J7V7_HIBTR|nr:INDETERMINATE(ID)-DOMAIN 15, SHOOT GRAVITROPISM 5, ARABIDOPSIS THALIANA INDETERMINATE(ID)-DOMAIN 15 [Hibiscus trionum]
MLDNIATVSALPSSSSDLLSLTPFENSGVQKRKRKPAGTPDPEAEVVSLSPRTLLESDRYVCEICNQGFQRDQNLQMHRRRHKVPWKLLKRPDTQETLKKKVFVCPEPSCLHHHPCHALGDLVGIKKHFRRKHSDNKQWVCGKCCKGYAVQSDYKAHLKTCGTKGHSCDCGRVFSRVETFIEHQDICTVQRVQPQFQARTASTATRPLDASFSLLPMPTFPIPKSTRTFELQLLPSSSTHVRRNLNENCSTRLNLSIGSNSNEMNTAAEANKSNDSETPILEEEAIRLKEFASEQLKLAMAEKAYAEKSRQEAKREVEMAEIEFASAKRIRQQARTEVERAQMLKDQSTKKISSTIMQITCQACKNQFITAMAMVPADETSLAMSYMSSATTEGEGE